MISPEQAAKTVYEKWYACCLKALAIDEQYSYVHPSEEIRLEMVRLPPIEEEDNNIGIVPYLAVQLQILGNDPLMERYMGIGVYNPVAMAMPFAGLD